jgi:hypothetical protein
VTARCGMRARGVLVVWIDPVQPLAERLVNTRGSGGDWISGSRTAILDVLLAARRSNMDSKLRVFISIAATVVLLASTVATSFAQPAVPGEAQLLPGGEWALGRWEGYVMSVGTSGAGTMGLNTAPRLFTIERDAAGRVRCRFATVPPPPHPNAGLTKRCVISPQGVSLVTSNSFEIELVRSGPDALQGTSKPPYAVGAQAPGLGGIQVTLSRMR